MLVEGEEKLDKRKKGGWGRMEDGNVWWMKRNKERQEEEPKQAVSFNEKKRNQWVRGSWEEKRKESQNEIQREKESLRGKELPSGSSIKGICRESSAFQK